MGILLKQKKWNRSGLTGTELQKRFPWAELPDAFPVSEPWYGGGFEAPGAHKKRLEALAEEIAKMKTAYGNDEVVVFVSHGGTIADVLFEMLVSQGKARPLNH